MVKAKRDPSVPKRGLTAYFMYAKVHREAVTARIAKTKKGDKAPAAPEVMKAVAREWRALTDKSEYEKMASDDKLRYERQQEQYEKEGKFDAEE